MESWQSCPQNPGAHAEVDSSEVIADLLFDANTVDELEEAIEDAEVDSSEVIASWLSDANHVDELEEAIEKEAEEAEEEAEEAGVDSSEVVASWLFDANKVDEAKIKDVMEVYAIAEFVKDKDGVEGEVVVDENGNIEINLSSLDTSVCGSDASLSYAIYN
eukprot:1064165_1